MLSTQGSTSPTDSWIWSGTELEINKEVSYSAFFFDKFHFHQGACWVWVYKLYWVQGNGTRLIWIINYGSWSDWDHWVNKIELVWWCKCCPNQTLGQTHVTFRQWFTVSSKLVDGLVPCCTLVVKLQLRWWRNTAPSDVFAWKLTASQQIVQRQASQSLSHPTRIGIVCGGGLQETTSILLWLWLWDIPCQDVQPNSLFHMQDPYQSPFPPDSAFLLFFTAGDLPKPVLCFARTTSSLP